MNLLDLLLRFFLRFRYPVTLPEDIASDLGFSITNYITFEEFVNQLSHPSCQPTNLKKFMPRDQAEAAFRCALRKDTFRTNSLFSYYFHEGWLEFILQFDEKSRLRRIYLQHKQIPEKEGREIPLSRASSLPFP